ncbi:MAG: hypothetical protein ABI832_16565 [bacterium]
MRLTLALCLCAAAAQAQDLTSPYPLARIDALPRLTTGTPAAGRINADFARRDSAVMEAARDCLMVDPSDQTGGQTGYWDRTVQIALPGPDFLSVVISDGIWCPGAAHPSSDTEALTYDLTTGAPVDWAKLLPPDWAADPALLLDNADQPSLTSPAMAAYYLRHYDRPADDDCTAVMATEARHFQVWPDAASHSLILMPVGIAHAVVACADWLSVPLADLTALHAAPNLITALTSP